MLACQPLFVLQVVSVRCSLMAYLPSILPKFTDEEFNAVVENAKEYACLRGILKYTGDGRIAPLQHTLVPSPFPKSQFHTAIALQTIFNKLYFRVAHDHDFLTTTLAPALAQDDYLHALWKLYAIDHELGPLQPLELALSRSDYMLNTQEKGWPLKQVEYNLIASSFGGITERLRAQHQMNLNQFKVLCGTISLPPNPSASGFGQALCRAVCQYVKCVEPPSATSHPREAGILIVISENETNVFDQRSIEEKCLCENQCVPILRRTFAQLAQTTGRLKVDKEHYLFVDGLEIGLVYYRTGYAPHQFDEEAWRTKFTIERTLAIKCPTIAYLLANTKLVQTALAQPNCLQRFIDDPAECQAIADTFAQQSFVSTAFGELSPKPVVDDFIARCLQNPEEYVLKPQREGGGNNIFGAEIVKKLEEIQGKPEANAFILMQRLHPPLVENCVVGLSYPPPLRRSLISELGIYGVLLTQGEEILENSSAGHLLRSKFDGVNEGGVASGYACLDIPYLV